MKITQFIFLGLVLTFYNLPSFAVEVKWFDETLSWYSYTNRPADFVADYADYGQLCTAAMEADAAYIREGAGFCFGIKDPSQEKSCKTFRFHKIGPFTSYTFRHPARYCYMVNDLGMQRVVIAMSRVMRCGPSNPWTYSFEDPLTYHQKYCTSNSKKTFKDVPGASCPSTKHPISIAHGNKFQYEVDYQHRAAELLNYGRAYNSFMSYTNASNGGSWFGQYARSIQLTGSTANVFRPDRKIITFNLSGGQWIADANIADKLIKLLDNSNAHKGWQYTVAADNSVEVYDINGRLISITDKAGNSINYTLSTSITPATIAFNPNLPIIMTDHVGRTLSFTYDGLDRIKTMTNPAGGVYTYTYDAGNNLDSVTYPDNTIKVYHYGEAAFVSSTPDADVIYSNSLTGITDENGNRYVTYSYDNEGRAYSETLANGADAASLVYNLDGSGNPSTTIVTDSRGSNRTYNFTTIFGVTKTTGQSQPGGAGCSASASNMTYDVNGNVASRTDFDGHKTIYQYDLNRNLETSRTEGLTAAGTATNATRTITTTWHATWSLPLVISEYSGASSSGTPLKTTAHTYDDRGNLTSFTETDPVLNLNRTTAITYTYSAAVPGLIVGKVVDGPRTDVNDTTTYSYYPHDAICTASSAASIVDPLTGLSPENLGCRGQLKSVKNALNQTTTYNRYNHHGQVEQMTDANGLVTTMTYDLRQRLTSRAVGTETTRLTYDNAGQVIQLQMPDSSVLNYTYDAAHRLIQVQDSLGNKVFYTLDAEGNRVKEDTTDLKGNLAKTLTRSYDALNRLQTVTGIE